MGGLKRDRDREPGQRISIAPTGGVIKTRGRGSRGSGGGGAIGGILRRLEDFKPKPRSRSHGPANPIDDPLVLNPNDLIHNLMHNKEDYLGSEWLSLYQLPQYLLTILQRFTHPLSPKPGLNPTISCCIAHGLSIIDNHREIQSLLLVRDQLNSLSTVSASLADMASAWFRSFPLSVPDLPMTGFKRHNLCLPSYLKLSLNQTAGDLGLSLSTLAVLAAQLPLINQPTVLPEHSKSLLDSANGFLKQVRIRRLFGQFLVDWVAQMDDAELEIPNLLDDVDFLPV